MRGSNISQNYAEQLKSESLEIYLSPSSGHWIRTDILSDNEWSEIFRTGMTQDNMPNDAFKLDNRGGSRQGAGRPATLQEPIRITVTLEKTQADWLAEQNRPASEIIRELIQDKINEPTN